MELAEITGAPIYAPSTARASFPHRALSDGDEFTVESLRFKLLETPGHTPDCSIYVVTDMERGNEPVLAFTGDTLLVGDVGRPDLFPDREEELAEKLFYSLKRIMELPDHVEVYPAHGMGSLCGRALSAKLWTTIGTERLYNYALQHTDINAFKKDLLTGMPEAPDHFSRCTEINRSGPELIKDLPLSGPLPAGEVERLVNEGKPVLDIRPYHSFAAGHIPGAYSISQYSNLPTFAGWVIPPEDDLILVLEHESDFERVKAVLRNVGLDRIAGYLEEGAEEWINRGLPLGTVETVSVIRLREWMREDPSLAVIDTRAQSEWDEGHIEGTVLVPAPDLRESYTRFDPKGPVVVFCSVGNRSMTGASILKQKGFKRVINAIGGTTAWRAAGYPLKSGADS
jgi:hydroxyacylglutathione hydrolase